MTTAKQTPAPGSDEAVDAGCICPVIDNAHGRGYRGVAGLYVVTAGCRLHDGSQGRRSPDTAKDGEA